MSFYVYIIKCSDGSLYTGSTTDLERRMREHSSGKGSAYTRVRLPIELVFFEEYPDRSTAQKREAQIKKASRLQKKTLIAAFK